MNRTLIATPNDPVLGLQRLVLAGVMFPHAAQKLFGWFGGGGLQGTFGFMHGMLGLPAPVVWLAIAAEILGTLSLVLGFLGRLGALAILAVQIGAVLTVHVKNGFFMNWSGQQPGEGYEFALLAIVLAVAVLIRGSGALSVDRALSPADDVGAAYRTTRLGY
jgi:putative oxidoreductase